MIKIFQAETVKELDAYTIEHEPIPSIDLMERAARAIADSVVSHWPHYTPVIVFCGPGNNGGDGLAVARLLSVKGYKVEVFLFNPDGKLSPDCRANKELVERSESVVYTEVASQFVPPALTEEHLVIDALFGSGLNKPLGGGFAAVVKYINHSPATVLSIDIPSGLTGEDNTLYDRNGIIRADYTFSLQFPKLSFLFAENAEFVGEWTLLDIGISPQAIEEAETPFFFTEKPDICAMIKPRKKFAHKGHFGHALLIAGSYGMAGASVLAAKACLRSGVGLLTIHAPAKNTNILQTTVPEAIVEPDIHHFFFASPGETDNYEAIAVGPGLGKAVETEAALADLFVSTRTPMVIDADAINFLSSHRALLKSIPSGSILTPHPKELERIVGKCRNSYERLAKACQLARLIKAHIILKGAYSAVITPEGNCFFNPTGNVGMATGGSGDVLTGIILALLAQGYTAGEAARIGAYAHGLAGDIAGRMFGTIAMTPGDTIESLPAAWQQISGF